MRHPFRITHALSPTALAVLAALVLVLPGCSRAQSGPPPNRDPAVARIVTEDVARFWDAQQRAAGAEAKDAARVYADHYLEPGSAGLRDFLRLRIESAEKLAATVAAHPRYYGALRRATAGVGSSEAPIRAAMCALAARYPDAVFPDVYLLVGRMSSGGTVSDAGLLIGLEMYGRTPDTPLDELGAWHRAVIGSVDRLPNIVAHELVHYQQRDTAPDRDTLLGVALREGAADFVAELISGQHINAHVHAWAEPRAAALWMEFRAAMHGTELKPWLYDTAPADGRPADLGYWVGYRIAKAHWERSPDKDAALAQLLRIDDYAAFLDASGAAEAFARSGAPAESTLAR